MQASTKMSAFERVHGDQQVDIPAFKAVVEAKEMDKQLMRDLKADLRLQPGMSKLQ